ncbi:MAG: endonuclease V [Desulfobacterota bacterium]|nr:endonuclease V [Thermodesulfobacteriota bacterium]
MFQIDKPLHPWEVSTGEAIRIQERLRCLVEIENRFSTLRTIGGADVAYAKEEKRLSGGIAVLSLPELELLDWARAEGHITFPYLPGLFSFREGPILLEAFKTLRVRPDLLLFEGHGIAHPRQFGLASHLGLWLDLPTIGCSRNSLLEDYEPPGPSKGDFSWVYLRGKRVGAVLRTREGTKPIFVSPGHRVDLETSVQIVLGVSPKYRIPEPLRKAHQVSRGGGSFNP